jgi:hypothetical protein
MSDSATLKSIDKVLFVTARKLEGDGMGSHVTNFVNSQDLSIDPKALLETLKQKARHELETTKKVIPGYLMSDEEINAPRQEVRNSETLPPTTNTSSEETMSRDTCGFETLTETPRVWHCAQDETLQIEDSSTPAANGPSRAISQGTEFRDYLSSLLAKHDTTDSAPFKCGERDNLAWQPKNPHYFSEGTHVRGTRLEATRMTPEQIEAYNDGYAYSELVQQLVVPLVNASASTEATDILGEGAQNVMATA